MSALHKWARLALTHGEGELNQQELFRFSLELTFVSEQPHTWDDMVTMMFMTRPDVARLLLVADETERVERVLEALLFFAVCSSAKKTEHIELIFRLDEDSAAVLKRVVEEQQMRVQALEINSGNIEAAHRATLTPSAEESVPVSPQWLHEGGVSINFELQSLVNSLRMQLSASQQALQTVKQKVFIRLIFFLS